MNHEKWIDSAEIYALGALDGEELKAFEAHLATGCPDCEKHMKETTDSLTLLAASVGPIHPPLSVKKKLLERITLKTAPLAAKAAPIGFRWWQLAGVGAALALLLVFLTFPFLKSSFPAKPMMVHDRAMTEVLSSPEVQKIELKGAEPYSKANGMLAWNPRVCRGCLMIKRLPGIPGDEVFQFWTTTDDGSWVSIGTFRADSKGHAHFDFPALAERKEYKKFQITVEPPGGSAQPTGPIQLAGRI